MSSKDELEKELAEVEERRKQLQRKILESDPKVMKRSKWEELPPQQQADHITNGGQLID